jgi:membrane-bound lytic murein transglycosylase B
MTITLKNTVIFSVTLAALLNVWQFASSYQQREDAFAPAWAIAASTQASKAATPSPSPAKLALVPTKPQPAVSVPAPVMSPAPATPSAAQVTVAQTLSAAGLKPTFASLYLAVQARTNTPWELLAAVHSVESGQSGSTSTTSYAGAVGPMQFEPATFSHFAFASDGDGNRDITNVTDAMYAAGRYLAADGASDGHFQAALYGYNHSEQYVTRVLAIADKLGL